MITLNPVYNLNNNFASNKVQSKNKIPAFNGKDEFKLNQKSIEKINVQKELMKFLKNRKAFNIIKEDLEQLDSYKQKVKVYDNNSKTVTFYKGLGLLDKSLKGELNLDSAGEFYSLFISNGKPEIRNNKKCTKSILINKVQGINVYYKSVPLNPPIEELIYDLKGNLLRHYYDDENNNRINLIYENGNLVKKKINYAKNNESSLSESEVRYKNGKPVLRALTYKPEKTGGIRTRVFDGNDNLILHKLLNIHVDGTIVNVTEDFSGPERIKTVEYHKNNKHGFLVRKGDLELKYTVAKKHYNKESEEVDVEMYKKGTHISTKKMLIGDIKDLL